MRPLTAGHRRSGRRDVERFLCPRRLVTTVESRNASVDGRRIYLVVVLPTVGRAELSDPLCLMGTL